MINDLQSDLRADLLTDLSRPAALPSAPLPSAPPPAGTPAVTVTLTPLRWARPSVEAADAGAGVAVRIGPWRVEVAL